MRIGIAGTGRMGAAIATRLKSLGHEVTVWNRTAERTRPLAAAGLAVAPTPQQLAAAAELVISILADASAVVSVYEALLAGEVGGKLFIEMSTVRPRSARELEARVRGKGAALVECPVGGSVGPAREGKLFGFAGGEAADVARAMPVLEQLCRRVEHVGPVGAGASMKLAINLPLLVYWQALAEALALCRPLGLPPQRLMDMLADTSGAPNMLKTRGPVVAAALAGEEPAVTVDIDTLRKDLREMVAEARERGHALPVTERTLECYEAASRDGFGTKDCTALPTRWFAAGK